MKKHERAFGEIKGYYQDVTHNNLDLIKTLKEEVAEMKKKEAANEKLMFEIANENKRLSEPLERALKEVDHLRHELSNYSKDKLSLQNAKARLVVQDDALKQTRWEHEVLSQKFEQVQRERDELYNRFEQSIYDVQQKAGLKNIMLEKKITDLAERLETKDAQLNEVLAKSDLDPAAKAQVGQRLQEVLDSKNGAIKELQFELARVTKAHNDLIRVYSAKLGEYGIPSEELGFRPITAKQQRAAATAGAM
jgi:chromosome segregation ATPase